MQLMHQKERHKVKISTTNAGIKAKYLEALIIAADKNEQKIKK